MKFTFNCKMCQVTDADREKIETKLSKFDRFLKSECITTVNINKNKNDYYVTEITIACDNVKFRTEQTEKTILTSIDLGIDTLFRQISKSKSRLEKRFNNTFDSFPAEFFNSDEDDSYEIIRTKQFAVKPMDTEEAILQMNMLGHQFFIFLNSDNSKINVIYKRKDGKYGLIDPTIG